MKRIAKNLVISLIFLCSCSFSKFVLTGNSYPPLPDDRKVKVIALKDKGKYELIGIIEIGESGLDVRIEEAKRLARANGGDAIMPKIKSDNDEMEEGYLLQDFLVLRTKKRRKTAIREVPFLSEEVKKPPRPKKKKTKKVFSNLPRASYKLLVEEYESLKGEKFRGSLFPTKFYKIPSAIISYSGSDTRFLELKTKSGKYKLYLLVPRDRSKMLTRIIKSKEKLNFVYTPITVYKSKYPVLEFLDVIE